MNEAKQNDSDSVINRFVDQYNADRYEETHAAVANTEAVGYIDPSQCVTLFGPDIRQHPDIENSPYGIDIDSLEPATSAVKADGMDGYCFTSPDNETHYIDSKFINMVSDVFDVSVETVVNTARVKVEWSDFPVLFEHPDKEYYMMVAPFIMQ